MVKRQSNSLRKDGIFHKLFDKDYTSSCVSEQRQSTLFAALADLCDLRESSASQKKKNPCYRAVYKLGTLLDTECKQSKIKNSSVSLTHWTSSSLACWYEKIPEHCCCLHIGMLRSVDPCGG